MSPIILFGVIAINLALIAYTVGIVAAHRQGRVTALVLRTFSVAAACDVVATACMIAGSQGAWFTLHGAVGYMALAVMILVVARLWRLRRQGPDALIPSSQITALRLAYGVWVIAYVFGVMLASRR